jgi:hypothetical protein
MHPRGTWDCTRSQFFDTEDPLTYAEAMDRTDSDKWLEAMRSEIQSMYDNTVWNLVVPLDG